ncbi:hypothetical protein RRG08_025047 [Elysia crispata]|uniref:Uncharacterized protein n=1 Tax=Elysia crispata TaxID=231223 RepID=A0AAE1ANZ1_9GAST|nr:hypothetical protein RRG08_025047 [Elysia crispata]
MPTSTYFACPNEGNCIPGHFVNDGVPDCVNGEDECIHCSVDRPNTRRTTPRPGQVSTTDSVGNEASTGSERPNRRSGRNKRASISNGWNRYKGPFSLIYAKSTGSNQMECDSMHGTIERKLNRDIFTPRDYALLMETGRQTPAPYHVREMFYSEAKKMSSDYVK